MRVNVSQPQLLGELSADLRQAGCVSLPISAETLSVVHPLAMDDHEEKIELTFFLKAWDASRAAGLELRS
jgi:hypothetical protein